MTYAHLRPAPAVPPTHPWQCMWGCRAAKNTIEAIREHEKLCELKPIGWPL